MFLNLIHWPLVSLKLWAFDFFIFILYTTLATQYFGMATALPTVRRIITLTGFGRASLLKEITYFLLN